MSQSHERWDCCADVKYEAGCFHLPVLHSVTKDLRASESPKPSELPRIALSIQFFIAIWHERDRRRGHLGEYKSFKRVYNNCNPFEYNLPICQRSPNNKLFENWGLDVVTVDFTIFAPVCFKFNLYSTYLLKKSSQQNSMNQYRVVVKGSSANWTRLLH